MRTNDALGRLRPISVPSTPEMIADQIRGLIMGGALPPQTQLTESKLAAQLLVSRGPIREALQRLVQEGLLRDERHRGVFVAHLTNDDVIDIYESRILIEGAAIRILFSRGLRPATLARLDGLVSEMKRAARHDDWAALTAGDLMFHESLVTASGSKRLARMYSTLMVESGMCLAMLKPAYAEHDRLAEEHATLRKAMDTKDAEKVTGLLEAHLRDGLDALLRLRSSDGEDGR